MAVPARGTDGFAAVLGPDLHAEQEEALAACREAASGARVWHVNSTAVGGGVAELLSTLLPYELGAGVDARWLVVEGESGFFDLTKRLHNLLHGMDPRAEPPAEADRACYDETSSREGAALRDRIAAGDVVVLHDPQTAGLIPIAKGCGAAVIWRCHIGSDAPNDAVRAAWEFLRLAVEHADAIVFSRAAFAWDGLPEERIAITPPCIDVLSATNRPLRRDERDAALAAAAIELAPDDLVVTQVSRWDRLKDPVGVLDGFVDALDRLDRRARLVLAGPEVDSVDDDPESAEVFDEVRARWRSLPAAARERVLLAPLPMDDVDANATMVNALQSRADVVVQKSLAEGFGLTVAEAMWKRRAVLASRVGGIQDQIVDGDSGVLLDDPADGAAYGKALEALLADPAARERMGAAAHRRVCDHFLPLRHFRAHAALVESVRSAACC